VEKSDRTGGCQTQNRDKSVDQIKKRAGCEWRLFKGEKKKKKRKREEKKKEKEEKIEMIKRI